MVYMGGYGERAGKFSMYILGVQKGDYIIYIYYNMMYNTTYYKYYRQTRRLALV